MKEYNALFVEVAQHEEQGLKAVDTEAGQARFLSELSQNATIPRRLKTTMAVVAVAATLLAVLGVAFFEDSDRSGEEQEWIQVGANDTRLLQLTDGTQIQFLSNSTGRVFQQIHHRGEVTLESGRVALTVPHKDDTDWKVLAGPYQIAVTGTRFDIEWDSKRRDLTVNVYEGSVWVTGPLLENGHAVTRNRSLSANLQKTSIRNEPLIQSTLDTSQTFGNESDSISPHTDKSNSSHHTSLHITGHNKSANNRLTTAAKKTISPLATARNGKTSTPWWLDDAKSGNYQQISAAIRTKGLDHMLGKSDASAWLILGNAARRANDTKTASAIYKKLRQKYPNTRHGATAALHLGRMAFDQQQQYATAAKWFNVYLHEQKGGTLHRETLGRLMEAQYKANMRDDARQSANRYLKRYPSGPHASKAMEIAQQ